MRARSAEQFCVLSKKSILISFVLNVVVVKEFHLEFKTLQRKYDFKYLNN